MKDKIEKIDLYFDDCKKKQLREPKLFCFFGGTFGLCGALVLCFIVIPLLVNRFSQDLGRGDIFLAVIYAVIIAACVLGSIVICFLPIFFGACEIYKISKSFSIVTDVIEYVTPYDEEFVRRAGTTRERVYYRHTVHFKEHGDFSTDENDFDKYRANDKYYIELVGEKHPKIVGVHSAENYELKRFKNEWKQ